MKPNRIRALLASDQPIVTTRLMIGDPMVVEAVGMTRVFDYIEFLAEYVPYDLRWFDEVCRAAELHSLGAMIKLDWEGRRLMAQRSVGSGFDAVLFADARSAEDVRDCIQALTPDTPERGGAFGVGARRHSLPFYGGTQEYVDALEATVVAIMIEKKQAVENLEEIVAVEGIDMVQWGPSDYAMSIGRPGDEEGKVVKDAERHVIATCLEAGINVRVEISSVEEASPYLELGIRHFSLGVDIFSLYEVLKDGGGRLRSTIEANGDRLRSVIEVNA